MICTGCGNLVRAARKDSRIDFNSLWYTGLNAEKTHQREVESVESMLARAGVEVSGDVLDISGGPGHVAAHLARRARRVVLTEVVEPALHEARRQRGLDARRFDFDGAPLNEVVDGRFDTLLCRFSLAWCLDLPRLAEGMAAVASPNAQAMLTFVRPSRGALIGTGLEVCPPRVFWHARFVERVFAAAGWRLESSFEPFPAIPYWKLHGLAHGLVSWPWALLADLPPRDLMQHHAGLVLRYGGSLHPNARSVLA